MTPNRSFLVAASPWSARSTIVALSKISPVGITRAAGSPENTSGARGEALFAFPKGVILEDAAQDGVTATAAKHGVRRFSVYQWQRKVSKAAAGKGPSPTSGPAPKQIETTDAEIFEERKTQPGLRPSQIVNQLRASPWAAQETGRARAAVGSLDRFNLRAHTGSGLAGRFNLPLETGIGVPR